MIVVLKNGVKEEKRNQLIEWLKGQGLGIHVSQGEFQTILGLIGDTTRVDMDLIAASHHLRGYPQRDRHGAAHCDADNGHFPDDLYHQSHQPDGWP